MPTLEAVLQELKGTVGDVMTDKVHSVRPNASIVDTANLMAERNVHRIVVIDFQNKVLGVVSQRDVLKYYLSPEQQAQVAKGETGAEEIHTLLSNREPVTVSPDLLLIKAALVLATNKIGCLPVVGANKQLVGLLSTTDLLRQITGRSSGSVETGFQFYSPHAEAKTKIPAYIRRMNGDLVIPLSSIDNHEAIANFAIIGCDPATSRILIKFVNESNGADGALRTKRDKEIVVVPASGFVARFDLTGKASAFDVTCREDSRYLVLTPKQGT